MNFKSDTCISCFLHHLFLWSSSMCPLVLRASFQAESIQKLFKDLLAMLSISRQSTSPKYIGYYTVSNVFTYKLIILKNIYIFSLIRLFTAVESAYLKNDHQMRYIISVIYVSDRGYSDLMIAKLSTNLLLKIIWCIN